MTFLLPPDVKGLIFVAKFGDDHLVQEETILTLDNVFLRLLSLNHLLSLGNHSTKTVPNWKKKTDTESTLKKDCYKIDET